jgi:hypothetical protein
MCRPPAIDSTFCSIDFLIWLDIHLPTAKAMHARGSFVD